MTDLELYITYFSRMGWTEKSLRKMWDNLSDAGRASYGRMLRKNRPYKYPYPEEDNR